MTAPLRHFRLFRVPDRTPENPKIGVRDPENRGLAGSGGGVENGVENGRKWHFSGVRTPVSLSKFVGKGSKMVENGTFPGFQGFYPCPPG